MAGIDHTPERVLMTADAVGGVWSYCMELCRLLSHIEFHLATAGAKLSEAQLKETESLQNVVVHETEYKLEWMEEPWHDIDDSGSWLLELAERIRPQLVHLNSYAYGVLPFKAPKLVVAHSDVFSWWKAVKGRMPPAEWNEYYQRVKKGLEGADLVIAPSKAMRKCINDIYRFTSPSKVIYNGRSTEMFHKGEKTISVFSMGRMWDEAKNIQLLVNAGEKINHRIRIAGDRHFTRNSFEPEAGKIEFLGRLRQDQIAAELSEASAFVLPARYEPFGLSALEAAYSGCALILGDIPSLREIWRDAAIFVDVNDEENLAMTINSLLHDPQQLKRYQYKALARADRFSSAAMAVAYLNVYQQSVQHKKAYLKPHTAL